MLFTFNIVGTLFPVRGSFMLVLLPEGMLAEVLGAITPVQVLPEQMVAPAEVQAEDKEAMEVVKRLGQPHMGVIYQVAGVCKVLFHTTETIILVDSQTVLTEVEAEVEVDKPHMAQQAVQAMQAVPETVALRVIRGQQLIPLL